MATCKLITIILFSLLSSTLAQVYRMPIPAAPKFYLGDFDGNGKKDLLRLEKGTSDGRRYGNAQVFLSTDAQGDFQSIFLDEDFHLDVDQTNLYIGDFNGDGRDDVLRQEKAQWDDDDYNTAYLLISNQYGVFSKLVLGEELEIHGDLTNLYIGDFNGDGKADILRQEKGPWDDDQYYTANVLLSNGDGTFINFVLPEEFEIDGDLTNLYIGDFNGDGLDDILRQEKGSWDDDQYYTANIFFSNGDGTFNKVDLSEEFELDGDLTNLYIGDFNGDRLDDILRQEKGVWAADYVNTANILFSNGDGTFNKVDLPEDLGLNGDLTNLYVCSFGGDNKDDILRQEKGAWDDDRANTVDLLYSNGDGTFSKWNLQEDLEMGGDLVDLYIGDLDGDGRDDIVRHNKEDGNPALNSYVKGLYANGFGGYSNMVLSELGYLK